MFDFQFKHFGLFHRQSTLKVGTDSVLLGSYVPVTRCESILDIGCGCGIVAFCIAYRLPVSDMASLWKIKITGIDIDAASVAEAKQNSGYFPVRDDQEIGFQNISVQDFAERNIGKFDLIACNPPFFHHALKPKDGKKIRSKHQDGNLSFEDLISSVEILLSETGLFYLILPLQESMEFERLCSGKLYLCDKLTIKPKSTKEINRVILGFSKESKPCIISELSIRDDQGNFTAEYKALTQEFYLSF